MGAPLPAFKVFVTTSVAGAKAGATVIVGVSPNSTVTPSRVIPWAGALAALVGAPPTTAQSLVT